MILSDRTLLANPKLVQPHDPAAVQPCSIDVHLGGALLRLPYGVTLDPETDQSALWQTVPLREDGRWLLGAQTLYLGATRERVTVPANQVALLHGVSSLGRLGLMIHVTAGLVDPGWRFAPLTLEIVSLAGAIYLRPGMRIGQLTFHALDQSVEHPYAGRYQDSQGVVTSRAHLDVEAP